MIEIDEMTCFETADDGSSIHLHMEDVGGRPVSLAMPIECLNGRHPGLGAAARRAMEDRYGWDAVMARLDGLLASLPA